MARVRLFGPAREAAGTAVDELPGDAVGELLDAACSRYGPRFTLVLERSAVWVNGEPAGRDAPVCAGDEVAVLPPVSGG
ncbi:MAG: MoaD/ThiS family protein [Actinomycetota bacterium]|nr:MoaD/ThiS family protein [Actinomycetota bacterium]